MQPREFDGCRRSDLMPPLKRIFTLYKYVAIPTHLPFRLNGQSMLFCNLCTKQYITVRFWLFQVYEMKRCSGYMRRGGHQLNTYEYCTVYSTLQTEGSNTVTGKGAKKADINSTFLRFCRTELLTIFLLAYLSNNFYDLKLQAMALRQSMKERQVRTCE